MNNFEEFTREDLGGSQIQETDFITTEATEGKYYEQSGNGEDIDNTANKNTQETQEMYKSIKQYKGFYIGRYETGIEEETERTSTSGINQVPVVKKNKFIYNYIKWGNSITDEKGGAVEKARNMYTNTSSDGIQSTLCYGVQWDAILKWINKDSALRYIFMDEEDSLKKGNYDISGNLIKTGSNESYQLKNIYDISGNVSEWTMETFGVDNKVLRGGKSGSKNNVSYRETENITTNSGIYGFRIALYIK